MSCDDFLKILVEQGGGRDPATKAAFEEHARTCEDCKLLVPAYAEYDKAMKEPKKAPGEDDPVWNKVAASAQDQIARKKLAATVAELTKKPWWHALLRPLGLVVLLAVGFVGGVAVGAGLTRGQQAVAPPPPGDQKPPHQEKPPGQEKKPSGGDGQPPPFFKPRDGGDITLEGPPGLHLKAAKALKALGDASWRQHAQAVIDDKQAARVQVEEARELLGE
ncbi:MAG TPA: hypothetical protein VFF73_24795 [Planctomycetota bacterium]|nr:hypothetical protein [Planctomycetota bacterium]